MEFPFKFITRSGGGGILYTATLVDGKPLVSWVDGGEYDSHDGYSLASVERFVDSGTWIVQEPDLVFPFIITDNSGGGTYEVYQDSNGVHMQDVNSNWRTSSPNLYSMDQMKDNIKCGAWIVHKPVEAPVEPSTEVSGFTIKVESKEAVAAVKELTEAINELGYAYSKLIEIQNRFKGN